MKLVLTVVLGIVASFAVTVLAEWLLLYSAPRAVLRVYPEFPMVAVFVGVLVGLIERNKTSIAAALSLAPWSVFMILGTNRNNSSASKWLITIVLFTIYSAVGVGAAVLAARIVRRSSIAKVST
jgi:hypothetical protein